MVTLYKLYFLSSHFSSQPNKRVFHPSIFLPSQPNTYERKLNLFYPSTFLSSHFSTLPPLFHFPNQTDPKCNVLYYLFIYYYIIIIGASPRYTTQVSCLLGFTVLNELGCLIYEKFKLRKTCLYLYI